MGRLPKPNPTKRLTLDLAVSTREMLERLQKETNADSLSEVIRRSLLVYEYLWNERCKGQQILVKGTGDDKEVVLL